MNNMKTKSEVQKKIENNELEVRKLANDISDNDIRNNIYSQARLLQKKLENEIIVLKWVLGDTIVMTVNFYELNTNNHVFPRLRI